MYKLWSMILVILQRTIWFRNLIWLRNMSRHVFFFPKDLSGQFITASAEVSLNGGLVRESPQNPLNSGLGIILICPGKIYTEEFVAFASKKFRLTQCLAFQKSSIHFPPKPKQKVPATMKNKTRKVIDIDGNRTNLVIILLMVQKSGVHQLRLVVYPSIYDGFFTSQVVQDFFHQQYWWFQNMF